MSDFWKAVAAKQNMMASMRRSGRYPYTYAYDLIREAGLADSRSAASVWVDIALEKHYKDDNSMTKETFCCALAEYAIEYQAAYDTIEAAKKSALTELRDMSVPRVTTEAENV